MNDAKSLGKVGGGFLVYLVFTSFIATIIGVLVALVIQPGKGSTDFLEHGEAVESEDFSFVEHFLNIIPTNIFESLVEMGYIAYHHFYSINWFNYLESWERKE
jgi:Na+/H+-dicarboxylate symporter